MKKLASKVCMAHKIRRVDLQVVDFIGENFILIKIFKNFLQGGHEGYFWLWPFFVRAWQVRECDSPRGHPAKPPFMKDELLRFEKVLLGRRFADPAWCKASNGEAISCGLDAVEVVVESPCGCANMKLEGRESYLGVGVGEGGFGGLSPAEVTEGGFDLFWSHCGESGRYSFGE